MIKKISFLITISITTYVYALPDCLNDPWHNPKQYPNRACFGASTYADGNKYVGEWQDGKQHGQGTFTSANGDKYVGEFQDGKPHGQGTSTSANGIQEQGYFLNNEFIPRLCKNMGLKEGTDVYGECILKLIDKI